MTVEPQYLRRGIRFNFLWTGIGALGSQGALFVSSIVFARLLHASALADYLVVLNLLTLVPALFSLGMERLGIVLISNAKGEYVWLTIRSIGIIAAVSSAVGGLAAALLVGSGSLLSLVSPTVAILVGAVVACENARIMLADAPRSWGRADVATLAGPGLPRIVVLIAVVGLHFVASIDVSLSHLLVLLLASTSCSLLISVAALRALASPLRTNVTKEVGLRDLLSIVRSGIPLSVANAALAVLGVFDTMVVAVYFDPAVVASYAMISRTSNLLGNAKTMLNVAVMPTLSRRPKDGIEASRQSRVARTTMTVLFLAALPSCLILGILAESIFGWLFGVGYVGAASAAIWLMLGQVVSIGMGLAGTILLRDGRQLAIMAIQVSAALVTGIGLVASAMQHNIALVGFISGTGTAICALLMSVVLWWTTRQPSWILSPREFVESLVRYRSRT